MDKTIPCTENVQGIFAWAEKGLESLLGFVVICRIVKVL